jgi:hypothetical protein
LIIAAASLVFSSQSLQNDVDELVILILRLMALCLACTGVWVSTRLAPRLVERTDEKMLRWLLRLAASLTVIIPVAMLVARPTLNYRTDYLYWSLNWSLLIASVGGTLLYFLYGARVAWSVRNHGVCIAGLFVCTCLCLKAIRILLEPYDFLRSPFSPSGGTDLVVLGMGYPADLVLDSKRSISPFFLRTAGPLWQMLANLELLRVAGSWWAILTLMLFALMSGRPAPAGSAENTEASSRP